MRRMFLHARDGRPPDAGRHEKCDGEIGLAVSEKPATAEKPEPLEAPWEHAIGLLDADLALRDAAPRTRRAYGVDVEGFARWAAEHGLSPTEVESKAVRRYVAHLSERGAAAEHLGAQAGCASGAVRQPA